MTTLTISEFSETGTNANGAQRQAAQLPAITHQTVAIGASSAQSATLNAATTLIRVATDTACRILSGANPTALATSLPLAAGQSEYFGVPAGGTLKIAVIAA